MPLDTVIHRKVKAARAGENPQVILRMQSGWAVMGDHQYFPGYCLLLPDPVVPHLNAMEHESRRLFLFEMSLLGDTVLDVTGALRINYEILGNLEPALHAHVFPRFADEPEEFRTKPPFFSPIDRPEFQYDPAQHDGLRVELQQALQKRLGFA